MTKLRTVFQVLLVFLVSTYLNHSICNEAVAQSTNPATNTQIQFLTEPITFDGIVKESEWADVYPTVLEQAFPNSQAATSEDSIIRVAYDQDFIYVSAIFVDKEAAWAKSLRRDDWNGENDIFGLLLDTFSDRENALMIFMYPTEARIDVEILNDAEGENRFNQDFNTFWDAKAGQLDGGGWQAEMRIPFSSLRFNADPNGETEMGLRVFVGFQDWEKFNLAKVSIRNGDSGDLQNHLRHLESLFKI